MPIIGGLVGGIGSGLAGLFGGEKQQKTQTSGTITNNSTTQGTGSYTSGSSTNPNFTSLQQALINQFTQGASSLYNQSQNLQPYEASGLEQINQSSNAASQAMSANLASKGLSFSPAAATAQNQNILSRTGQQSQFANSIPLLQRQLQQQALGQLTQAFSVIPTGQTQAGSGTTQQNQTQNSTQTQQGTNLVSGNPIAGGISGLLAGGLSGANLGLLYNNFQGNSANNASNNTAPPM
jgi:hypothetical protein